MSLRQFYNSTHWLREELEFVKEDLKDLELDVDCLNERQLEVYNKVKELYTDLYRHVLILEGATS